jgi:hypothetical protein
VKIWFLFFILLSSQDPHSLPHALSLASQLAAAWDSLLIEANKSSSSHDDIFKNVLQACHEDNEWRTTSHHSCENLLETLSVSTNAIYNVNNNAGGGGAGDKAEKKQPDEGVPEGPGPVDAVASSTDRPSHKRENSINILSDKLFAAEEEGEDGAEVRHLLKMGSTLPEPGEDDIDDLEELAEEEPFAEAVALYR